MPDSTYRFTLGADPQAREVIQSGLQAFNIEQIGPYSYQGFELYAHDDTGQVVGGMFGYSGMGWLYIDYLWLHATQRSAGLGTHLLALAEEEARSRGCIGLFLYTYNFQAPDFYQKQGYQLMGVLEDCPPGYQRLYLKKRLAN
ncbi:GNAT family N-acetyltransferase [Crenobacter sp. SG2303]|uniref:GNAT family N-acetyltransferase n=1 Tax=Crenobacter oryzisoli TaxID=3056844 RepID=A0ABT7XPB4_9NEIS|nr:GNAT family N-acetyltransferase [Crenobacter sp. SG2303]MDN0075644.1 GNAT family N-acetyltransferase [Crenobacter sp. SG2303]